MAFSEATKLNVKKKADFTCCWCRDIRNKVEVHHIIPQVEGGSDNEDNAAPLCGSCHTLYGGNPDLRKEIKLRRDQWYELCLTRTDPEGIKEYSKQSPPTGAASIIIPPTAVPIQVTTQDSPWYSQICEVCENRFRVGDQVRLCPQCGKPYHDDDQYELHCWSVQFMDGRICTEPGFDPTNNREIPGCDFRPLGKKVGPGDPIVRRTCPWCKFYIRAGDWVVACPCGHCNTYFHQDVFRQMTCWDEYVSAVGDYCPTSGARLRQ